MSTYKIGDTWITFHRHTTGIASGKLASKQEAHERSSSTCDTDGQATDTSAPSSAQEGQAHR